MTKRDRQRAIDAVCDLMSKFDTKKVCGMCGAPVGKERLLCSFRDFPELAEIGELFRAGGTEDWRWPAAHVAELIVKWRLRFPRSFLELQERIKREQTEEVEARAEAIVAELVQMNEDTARDRRENAEVRRRAEAEGRVVDLRCRFEDDAGCNALPQREKQPDQEQT